MTQNTKYIGLLLLTGALVSLILLAASLSNLQLHAGSPFPGGVNSDNSVDPVKALPPVKSYSFSMLRGIFALIFLILMIYVPARIIMLVNVKMILRLVLAMVLLLIILYMMPRITLGQTAYYPNGSSEIATSPSFSYPVTPLGRPPQVLVWLVIIGIVLGIGLLIIKVLKKRLDPTQIEAEFLQGAEDAVNALEAGVDLRSVIIRCYLQMTRSLQEEKGIERKYAMTVREFEGWLEFMGFPTVPVHQLTRLFEKARYGKQQMSDNDKEIAMESLNEIIQFCRSERD